MATAEACSFQQPSTDSKAFQGHTVNVPMSGMPPPNYYTREQNTPIGNGAVITTPQFVGMHVIQPTSAGTTVLVTQPVVTVPVPSTTCSLVCSVLSSIFCCFVCGIAGILVAWKARLYILEKKYDQARHSVSIVWLFFGLAIFFGIVTWSMVTLYIIVFSPYTQYYYRNDYYGK